MVDFTAPGVLIDDAIVTPRGGTAGRLADILAGFPFPGYLFGLTLANNATDATNDIDFAAGRAVDSTGVALMIATAKTKQLDAAWAAGTGAGGRMSAAAITDTTYHCFVIMNPTTGAVDCGFDTSPTAPTLPTGYTLFRRVGSIIRSGATILAFLQNGDDFSLVTSVASYSLGNPGTSAVLVTMSVPSGIKLKTRLMALVTCSDISTTLTLGVKDPAEATAGAKEIGLNSLATAGTYTARQVLNVYTNTSGQIQFILNTSTAGINVTIHTHGWADTRGRV